MVKVIGCLALLVVSETVWAAVRFATPFKDKMVLQRGMEVPVWGTADANEKVVVRFGPHRVSATARADGRWAVKLPAMPASKENRVLEANGAKVRDVLVGEVWFCAGQSNMEFPLVGDNPHFSDRQGLMVAQLTRKPTVRFAYSSNYKWSVTPKTTYEGDFKAWQEFTPENLGTGHSFSAIGSYFALELASALDVPIGVIGTYWGGTGIDPWIPSVGYEGIDSLKSIAGYKPVTTKDHQQPTVLFNEMVNPWAPFAVRGMIWYQGCNNADEAHLYCDKMHALYNGWSKKFRNPDLKLYFVQLAPWMRSWFDIQLAQEKFADEEKNAGLVTSCDAGNRDDIHPYEKEIIARRLAALALKRDYGFKDIVADYPRLKGWKIVGDQFRLTFDNVKKWHIYSADWEVKTPFEIAGADGQYKQAFILNANNGALERRMWQTCGMVEGPELRIVAPGIGKPVSIRYLHNDPWVGNLFADSGLPLGPMQLTAEGEAGGEPTPGPVQKRFEDIHIRDPFVLVDGKTYYLYRSRLDADGWGVFVKTSTDLEHWSKDWKRVMSSPKGVPVDDIWAPEVHRYNGKYYLFATVVKPRGSHEIKAMGKDAHPEQFQPRGTWILRADRPTGPFVPMKKGPIISEDCMTLDGTLVMQDGKPYMVYCHEWIQLGNGTMNYVELTKDLSAAAGEPVRMFDAAGNVHGGWVVTDGPFFHRSETTGKLFMIWSNMVFQHGYSVLVQCSESGRLEGPWTRSEILYGDNGGHGMIFKALDDRLYLALHQPNDGGKERLNLFELKENGNRLELKTKGE